MLSSPFSPWRSVLLPQEALDIAAGHLDNARKSKTPKMTLAYCDDAKTALSRIRRSARKDLMTSSRIEDRALCSAIAVMYLELGELLVSLAHRDKAQDLYANAVKWGGHAQSPDNSSFVGPAVDPAAVHAVETHEDPVIDLVATHQLPQPSGLASPLTQDSPVRDIASIPPHIFAKDMHQPPDINRLPRVEERLESISQLVHCLDLLDSSQPPDDSLDETERSWLIAIEHDPEEKDRLKMLATNLLREFAREELKDAKAVAEIVCLVPVLSKDDLQLLLQRLFHGIEQSKMLDFNLVEGLAQLVQRAAPGHINADNLVKILELISTRLKDTHRQSPDYICQLTITVSHVLDAMADSKVKGLDREQLHAPLAAYLHGLEGNTDPYLVYQAAYASQALLYVPDNETPWQATVRRTGKVVKGVSGLVSAVKGLDVNGFVEGLSHIQEGLAGVSEMFILAKGVYDDVSTLTESGQQFSDYVKEGLSFSRKRAWYPALRGSDILLQNGQFMEFRRLVCEAPCRRDPAFQWGICQRLGDLASNTECDDDSRTSAIAFLGEIYKNDTVWGSQASTKQWILEILMNLAAPSGCGIQAAETLLQELENDGNAKKQELYRFCRNKGQGSQPLKVTLPISLSRSLLDRVQKKVDVNGSLRQLKERRLEDRSRAIYISPQAKASLQARNNELFPLMDKVKEFLEGDQKVFLVLGDSGAGKSTFNRELECDLWNGYKSKDHRIPLFITLAAIQNPEDELIAKHLKKEGFTESQIQELKGYREFILICDGYDESRQTHNLYTSNRLNQRGEWRAQMVVSCRSEYLGADYQDQFQPVDRNHQADRTLFQQAVITPFSKDQVEDYVHQFVSVEGLLWRATDYIQALDQIAGLKDLVTNPFMLTLSLEVLPSMVDPGENLSAARVTRVALYDQFVEQWLERGKKSLVEKVSDGERKWFKKLSDEGFTQRGIMFLKQLATAIFDNQAGNSVVEYPSFNDQDSWKEAFFGQEDEKKLLLEACPLNRSGRQFRFLHRSLLEYSLARAVFEPQERLRDGQTAMGSITIESRRGSVSSEYSFESHEALEEVVVATEQPLLTTPLGRKNFVGEPSILRFLVERVQQEPLFKRQLLAVIERSKSEQREIEVVRRAASNSITILVRAGVQFNGADLQGIRIPGADLSYGVFDCAQFQGADMRKVTLRSAWLRGANLSNAQLAGVQFGELPFLQEEGRVGSCAYSGDGKTFSVGLNDGSISIYTTSTWERMKTLRCDVDWIGSISYSPKGDRIVPGRMDKIVQLWDVDTGECRQILSGHVSVIDSIAYSPRGDQIASGSYDKTVRLWDVETGECRHILSGHSGTVLSVTFSPKGDQVASGSWDKTVRLWDVVTGECRYTLSGHTDRVISIGYSPKGDQIASGGYDKTVRLWDVVAGECRYTLSGHSDKVMSIAYSPKGDQIASGSSDSTIRLWDVETGECRHTLNGPFGSVIPFAYSPKGDQIASGSQDKTVKLWDVETGECRHTLSGHSEYIYSIAYSPKGDQIASGSFDKTVRLWDVETGERRHILSGHISGINSIKSSLKDDRIASASDDRTVRLWDVETGECRHTFGGHNERINSIAYSPKGDQIAFGSNDSTVLLWDIETGECRHILSGHSCTISSILYSPKGYQIASASDDSTVRLWDVETGECSYTLGGHEGPITGIAYSPKGDQISSFSHENVIWLWDAETGEYCHILIGHSDQISDVKYSPKGGQIASGSWDMTVRLWDVETGECCHILNSHSENICSFMYSPKGDQIASRSFDKTVRLWDVETGECRHILSGHSEDVFSFTYSPKGDQIASVSFDKTVRLWDVEAGECRHILGGHMDDITNIAYSPTGNRIAFVSGDSTIWLWDTVSGQCLVVIPNFAKVDCFTWKETSTNDCLAVGCSDGSVLQWEVVEQEHKWSARLCWRSPPRALVLTDVSAQGSRGLSLVNSQLLKQRGAGCM